MFSHLVSSAARAKLRQGCAGTADPRPPAQHWQPGSRQPRQPRAPSAPGAGTHGQGPRHGLGRASSASCSHPPCGRFHSTAAAPGSPASAFPGCPPPAAFAPRAFCRVEWAGVPRAAAKSRGRCLAVPLPRAAMGLPLTQPSQRKVLSWCPGTSRPNFPDMGHKSSSGERGMHPVLPKLGWPLGAGNGLPVPQWPCRPSGPRHDAEGSIWGQPGYFCCGRGMQMKIPSESQPRWAPRGSDPAGREKMQNPGDGGGWSYGLLAESRASGWPGDGAGSMDPTRARPAHGQRMARSRRAGESGGHPGSLSPSEAHRQHRLGPTVPRAGGRGGPAPAKSWEMAFCPRWNFHRKPLLPATRIWLGTTPANARSQQPTSVIAWAKALCSLTSFIQPGKNIQVSAY